ncbi:protein phosphatase 2C [Strigomonas culicis]|uniref:Protein phosphatase n=1 Tax=Strigomonas culicis TaxID=28005 RepID=S9TUD3_9TRYP|nr:protein phosphatase 2C [Strigomonas culicis]|eukprot:EPY20154.1 protein phosphatase 2C [Strigomonas culicis]
MFRRSLSLLGRRLCFRYRTVKFTPHPDKIETGGDDAFLSLDGALSVLDGVSWWKDNAGVDAGLYSAAMARAMYDYIEDELFGDIPVTSFRLLDRAYEQCKHSEVQGTCTALVATLQEPKEDIHAKDGYTLVQLDEDAGSANLTDLDNPLLDVVSVGDCSLMVLRYGKIIYRTEEQAHAMDFPFQLGTGSKDTPSSGIKVLVPVQPGDVVVMGSDGIFDNVYPERILEAVWPPLEKVYTQFEWSDAKGVSVSLQSSTIRNVNIRNELADSIMAALEVGGKLCVEEAINVSKDIRSDSPYAAKCIEDGALYEGGKPDDMTLLLSVIGIGDNESSGERFSGSEISFPIPYRDWP